MSTTRHALPATTLAAGNGADGVGHTENGVLMLRPFLPIALQLISVVSLYNWLLTLTLVFGGCCTNAITLEQLTSEYPQSGSLITFLQFFLISLHGLPKHITFSSPNADGLRWGVPVPRLKPRKIPITTYLVQVALFYLISLLNNAAFGYHIPMAVHIIFRSGGLIVSMLLGWTIAGKRYTTTQTMSVILVTIGVILTTLSVSRPVSKRTSSAQSTRYTTTSAYGYVTGVTILTLALLLSGFLGLVQDWTYKRHGRPIISGPSPSDRCASTMQQNQSNKKTAKENGENVTGTKYHEVPAWQESMFYLHFLSLPMFYFVRHDLLAQFHAINAGSLTYPSLPLALTALASSSPMSIGPNTEQTAIAPSLAFPTAYIPLLLNTFTQLLCIAGVFRLTTQVSALTVTLILVVRKAASFINSVLWLRGAGAADGGGLGMMWLGAALVMAGTVGYSVGSGARRKGKGTGIGNVVEGSAKAGDSRGGKVE